MNIFVLDLNPELAAKYHCDRHVIKMILETAQLLSTAHWKTGGTAPYKATHASHPCAKWARESIENYSWLCVLGLELCKEYTKRYGKVHKTQSVLEWLSTNVPNLPKKPLTPFAIAMTPDYVVEGDVVASYRNYYKGAKTSFATWKTQSPPWWNQPLNKA
jgi:hypothetical protein